jgi:hypothetical protein
MGGGIQRVFDTHWVPDQVRDDAVVIPDQFRDDAVVIPDQFRDDAVVIPDQFRGDAVVIPGSPRNPGGLDEHTGSRIKSGTTNRRHYASIAELHLNL